MEVSKLGLFIILLQLGNCFCEEAEQCQPGFSSDSYVFKVTRKLLEQGRVLGKVSFDDCSGRRLRAYNTEDNRIRINPDGTVSVKRQLALHAGIKTFAVHTWDSSGNKFSTQVLLCNELEHTCTERLSPDRQTENELGLFTRHKRGLQRQKRDWAITAPILISENQRGLYPKKLVQIRHPETYISYSITGPGANKPPVGTFTIDSSNGWVMVTRPLDREVVDTYKLECNALSAAGPVESPLEITIRVTDMNDNRPEFTQPAFQGRVQEGSQPGTSVMRVTATDADDSVESVNGVVAYKILDQEPKLPNEKMFTINRSTGVIAVDYMGLESQKVPQYTLILQAADMDGKGLMATSKAVIDVIVANAGDPSPCKSMSASPNSPLTTHVLNTASGAPAKGLQLQLSRLDAPTQKWVELTTSSTNSDGRCPGILSPERFTAGTYKLRFETGEFWKQLEQTSFYPYVEVVFTILDPSQKFHIPLLLSPYSYTTYRGS